MSKSFLEDEKVVVLSKLLIYIHLLLSVPCGHCQMFSSHSANYYSLGVVISLALLITTLAYVL